MGIFITDIVMLH